MTERRRPPRPVSERRTAIEPTPTGRPSRVVRRQALGIPSEGVRPSSSRTRRPKGPPTLPGRSDRATPLTMIEGSGGRADDVPRSNQRDRRLRPPDAHRRADARGVDSRFDDDRRSAGHGASAPTERPHVPLRMFAIVGAIGIAAVAFLTIAQPMRQWQEQRREIGEAEQRLDAIERQRERTRQQTEELGSDEAVRRTARELFEMVDPGEELVVVLPPPSEDLGLPNTWPFSGVERELGLG